MDKATVKKQLDALGDFHKFFTSKELRYLPDILNESETIHAITSGLYDGKTWIIVITDIRMMFLDKGMFYGLRQVDLPLSQISSVSHKAGLFFSDLRVSTSAGTETIGSIPKKDVLKLSSILSGLIHGTRKKPGSAAQPQSQPVIYSGNPGRTGLSEQLERLFILREKGALTEEEYTISKAKVLNSNLL